MANTIITLEDVARLAGVSKSTASRILAVEPGTAIPFSPATQQKVRKACEVLGYRPSKLARGLTGSRTGIIGLIIPSVMDSFFPSVTSVIEANLAKNGYAIILANTSGNSETEQAKIEDLLAWRVDGLIIAPAQETGNAAPFWELWRRGIPFVLIDRFFPDTPFYSIVTDDRAGAIMAVRHLLSIGRRRIAEVGGPLTVSTNRLRHEGYVEALIRGGILPDPNLSIEISPTEGGGRAAVEKLMAQAPLPDALFCSSDPIAIGAMEECMRQGIRIPEDLALVGYADLDYSHMLRIPLTTVRQPRELLGQRAAEVLIARMENKDIQPPQRMLPVELVVRESSGSAMESPRAG